MTKSNAFGNSQSQATQGAPAPIRKTFSCRTRRGSTGCWVDTKIQLCSVRLGRTMLKVLLFVGGLSILFVSSRQWLRMFRDGSFRARGNRLIVRNAHPIIFWMNFVGLVLFGIVGVALICWQLLT